MLDADVMRYERHSVSHIRSWCPSRVPQRGNRMKDLLRCLIRRATSWFVGSPASFESSRCTGVLVASMLDADVMRYERQSVSRIRSWCPSRVPQRGNHMKDLLRCLIRGSTSWLVGSPASFESSRCTGVLVASMLDADVMRYERQSVSHIRSWCPSRVPQHGSRMKDLLRCLIRRATSWFIGSPASFQSSRCTGVLVASMLDADVMRYERQSVSRIRSWCPSRVTQRGNRMKDLLRCLIRRATSWFVGSPASFESSRCTGVLVASMLDADVMRYERQSVSHIRSWCPSRVPQRGIRMKDLLRCLIRRATSWFIGSPASFQSSRCTGVLVASMLDADVMRYERQSVSRIRSWCPSRVPQRGNRMKDLLRCLIRRATSWFIGSPASFQSSRCTGVLVASMLDADVMRYERQSVSHIRSWCPSRVPQRGNRMKDLLRCLIRRATSWFVGSPASFQSSRCTGVLAASMLDADGMRCERQSVPVDHCLVLDGIGLLVASMLDAQRMSYESHDARKPLQLGPSSWRATCVAGSTHTALQVYHGR